MPLLNRKPYQCDASLPEGLKAGEEVFVIEYSKEVFRDYAAYIKKRELYRKPVWSCKYTGKGGLTFEEAQAEEQKALAGLTKFTQELEEQVVRTVHHSLLPLDKLLSAIYDKLRPPTGGEAATVAAAQQGEQQREEGNAAAAKEGPKAEADNNDNNNAGAGAAQGGPEVSPLAEKENKVQQATPATAAAEAAAGVSAKPEKPAERSGPKKPKAPVARQLLRTFVLEHASQQGPEGGKLQVWVVKPELARKYELPADVPDEVKEKLAAAAKPPKKRPSDIAAASGKQEKKVRKEGGSGKKAAAAGPAAASRPSSASPLGAVASGAPVDMSGEGCRAEGMDDSEPPRVPVQAKTLEEVESQYKEGTIKHVMVKVLKAHPEGLTTAALAEQAKEMGLADYDDKQKRTIRFNFSNDTNFVRMAQAGVYSLHCFHPELVVLQKPPVPRKRKITEHFLSPGDGVEEQQEGSAAAAGKPLPKVESRVDLGGEQAAEKSGKKKLDKAGKLQADKEQQEEVEEVDGITKAERLIRLAKAAAERHRAALAGAQKAFDEAKKALADIRKSMQLPSPSKARDAEIQIPPEQLSKFELSAEEREFKGEEGDRKALSEHRQFLQRRVKELEAQKKAFIEAERAKREGERAKREADLKNSNTQYKAAEAALKRREHELAQARRAFESATKALAEAERKLAQERKKVETAEAKAKEKEEKEKQRQAEKEERDRRKAEAQAAKRYPIDDLVLLQELTQAAAEAGDPAPATDVEPPSWLGGQEQSRLACGLYVSDFLHQFGKSLAIKPLSFIDLERVLGAAGSKDAASGDELGAATLHGVYQRLLQVLLDDLRASGEIGAMERRWRCVLSEGTWPEVLRRYVLTRAHVEESYKRPNEHVSLAAGMLGFDSADALTHDQHLHLLRFLCDEVLDTEKMRTALQKRADGADDARRDILKEMAEERKKLRAQQEQEREERKRRKEEDKKKQEEEKAVAAAAAAADGSAAQDGNATDQAGGGLSKQGSINVGTTAVAAAAGTPAEPSFELPNELREYQGHPDDKKAILQFRQQQQAEKRRLEKERNKWLAEQLRRQREIEAKLKEQREAEKAKQREKEAVEEAISRAQDELEEALERYSTRRLPLGCDRHHRRYWWGLAAHRPAVYVEDEQGRWGAFTTMEEVESLLDSLDRRGVRELALAQALEKRMGTIQVAIRKAAQAEEKDSDRAPKSTKAKRAEKAPPQPLRRSGREAQQVEFFNPGKAAGNGGACGSRPSSGALAGASKANSKAIVASVEVAGLFGPSELAAFQGVLADLAALEKAAAAAEVAAPAAPWADWLESLRVLAEGQDGLKAAATGLRRALQVRLQEFEAAVYGVSDKRDDEVVGDEEKSSEGQDEDGSDGDREGSAELEDGAGPSHTQSLEVVEYVDSDGELSPTKGPRDVAWLWRSTKERSTWQADLSQAGTIARLAYCASVLLQQAEPLLHTLHRAAAKRGATAGSRGGAAAPAAAVAGAGQPVRGSSKGAGQRSRAPGTAAATAEVEDVGGKGGDQRAAREARRQAREWGVVPADLLEAGAGGVSRRDKAGSGASTAAPAGKRKGAGQAAAAQAENVRVTRARKG